MTNLDETQYTHCQRSVGGDIAPKYHLEDYVDAIMAASSECTEVFVTFDSLVGLFTFRWCGHTWGHEKTLPSMEIPPEAFAQDFLQQHREARDGFKSDTET